MGSKDIHTNGGRYIMEKKNIQDEISLFFFS